MKKQVVSLFAGIGGFDLGFERAGFEIVAHVEKDEKCRELLAAKWPNAVALDDVCTAGAHNLPACDVVTFGFPCQDLSVAGKRAGLDGGRSGLYYEATRIINELRPAFCLFENVPGLLSSEGGRDFARVLMEMDRIGYHGAWRVLDAQWLGVAQRRRRVFGLFSRLDSGAERCAEILSLRDSLRGHPAPSREAGQGVAGTLTGGADGGSSHGKKSGTDREGFLTVAKAARTPTGGIDREDMHTLIPAVAGTLRGGANGHRGYNDPADSIDTMIPAVAGTLGANHGNVKAEHAWTGQFIPAVAGCLQERDAKGADSDTKPGHLIAVNSGQGFWKESDHAGTLGTEARAVHENNLVPISFIPGQSAQSRSLGETVDCSVTVKGEGGGSKAHVQYGMQVRRLTPTECERLQGFPDGHTAGFSDSCRYRMLGNAVAVPVAEWIAKRMAERGQE